MRMSALTVRGGVRRTFRSSADGLPFPYLAAGSAPTPGPGGPGEAVMCPRS